MATTITLLDVDVTLKNDINYYCLYDYDPTEDYPLSECTLHMDLDLEKVYKELLLNEIKEIVDCLSEEYQLSKADIMNDTNLMDSQIINRLKELYQQRSNDFSLFQAELSVNKPLSKEEFSECRRELFFRHYNSQLQLRHKCQMLTNAYAYLHNADMSQIVNMSYSTSDQYYGSIIYNAPYPAINALERMEYYHHDAILKDIKAMKNNGMIPIYGVSISYLAFRELDEVEDIDDIEPLDPNYDTLLPEYICYLNLSIPDEYKTAIVKQMHDLAKEGKNKKDIFHNIIVALYCLGYLPSIPTMVSVAKEFESELRKFVKDKEKETEKLIRNEEWKDIKNTIDPDDADEFEQTIKKYHDKGKVFPVSSKAPYYKHFQVFKQAIQNVSQLKTKSDKK